MFTEFYNFNRVCTTASTKNNAKRSYIYVCVSVFRWHPQLQDKAAGVKTHKYWSMLQCQGDERGYVLH